MKLQVSRGLLSRIQEHGEGAYPEEGAGFLLGIDGPVRTVEEILPLENAREANARRNRYLIDPQDYIRAELMAAERKLDVIGVFHSHPDHPEHPSEYDRDWAQPRFSYLITSVVRGKAVATKSWWLTDDRRQFAEEEMLIK